MTWQSFNRECWLVVCSWQRHSKRKEMHHWTVSILLLTARLPRCLSTWRSFCWTTSSNINQVKFLIHYYFSVALDEGGEEEEERIFSGLRFMTYFMTPIACIINWINMSLRGHPSIHPPAETTINPALVNYWRCGAYCEFPLFHYKDIKLTSPT